MVLIFELTMTWVSFERRQLFCNCC